MKKYFLLMIFPLLTLVLISCSNEQSGQTNSELSEVDLTERERAILATTTDQSFVFEFTNRNETEEASVWVEKYESGQLVEQRLGGISTHINGGAYIIFTTLKAHEHRNEFFYNMSISSNGGTATSGHYEKVSGSESENLASLWESNPEHIEVVSGKEIVLASLCYAASDGVMRTLSTDFYRNMDLHLHELENYDVVYVVKGEFK
ncbi:MAG: hypothetical protein LPK26_14165 [Bacillaceae bacterium]|nr:hypothetical protein [Bacillaceae bacterium]